MLLLAQALNAQSTPDPAGPFYWHADFWISTALGIAGLVYSVLSFLEAGKAKTAAIAAGKSVKLQTVVIELSEISQKLDNIDQNLDFSYSRELLSDASRRLRRQLASLQNDVDVKTVIADLFGALDLAKNALAGVRPVNSANGAVSPDAVFYAMEGHFSVINVKLAELTGLLEARKIDNS